MLARRYFYIVLFLCFDLYAQTSFDSINIYVDFDKDSKSIAAFSNAKEGKGISIGIYMEGFETKVARDRVLKKKQEKTKFGGISERIPSVSLSYLSFKEPQLLQSLEGVNCLSIGEFKADIGKYTGVEKTYIIYKNDDEGYLKWDVELMPTE